MKRGGLSIPLLRRQLLGIAKTAGGARKAAGRAIGVKHFMLPWQSVAPGHHVLHVGIGAVLRTTFNRHIPPVAELVDVVFNRPVLACPRAPDQAALLP